MTVKKGGFIKNKFTEIQYYSSDAIDELALAKDLSEIFNELIVGLKSHTGEVLIFIDATNGNLSITPFDSQKSETEDDSIVIIELTEFWEDTQNGYDFDEILGSCIRTALGMSPGSGLFQRFTIFLQTEVDEHVRVKV